jgi:acetyltransferase-like isoleucine patch superfamily enzyme
MMRKLIEKLIRKRNSSFRISKEISEYDVVVWFFSLSVKYVRGIVFHFLSPFSLSLVGKGAILSNRRYLKLGRKVKIDDYVYIDALGKQGVSIGDGVNIGAFSRIVVSSSYSNIGEGIVLSSGVGIGEYSRIGGSGGVYIGENTIIGQYLSCHPENHIFDNLQLDIKYQGTKRAKITIGRNCWLGSKVTICAGVKIGDGSVIGAGAVVTKSVPENSIVAGNPAKVLRIRGRDE